MPSLSWWISQQNIYISSPFGCSRTSPKYACLHMPLPSWQNYMKIKLSSPVSGAQIKLKFWNYFLRSKGGRKCNTDSHNLDSTYNVKKMRGQGWLESKHLFFHIFSNPLTLCSSLRDVIPLIEQQLHSELSHWSTPKILLKWLQGNHLISKAACPLRVWSIACTIGRKAGYTLDRTCSSQIFQNVFFHIDNK